MKSDLRKEILKKRDSLSEEDIRKKSEIIAEKLFSSSFYRKAGVIMFYVSIKSEVETKCMIAGALKDCKKVCVPITKENELIPSLINSLNDLDSKGKFNIPEPSKTREISKEDIDLIIVPGAVFDKSNHRIGYGKGYYDSFLKEFKGKKIGLAFSFQVVGKIPVEDWDVALDLVLMD